MEKPLKILYAMTFVLLLQPLSRASSLLVSYTTAAGGGGIELFSLIPQSAGTVFDSENAPVTSVTTAGNSAYWVAGAQVTSDSLTDTTGGSGKTLLPSVPFGGVSITDLAVDAATNSYLVGWNAPGFGWFVAQYPLAPAGNYTIFSNDAHPVQGLTVAGNMAYWIDGTTILSEKTDGTGKAVLQSFPFGNVTLNDVAIDTATNTYLAAASTPGIPPLLVRYPLTPNATGVVFAFASANVPAVTVAGGQVYWIDGQNVWSENINGTGKTLVQTLPSQFTPTDLAISLGTPAAVPEPGTTALLGSGLMLVWFMVGRARRAR